jgi:hypothetical protein
LIKAAVENNDIHYLSLCCGMNEEGWLAEKKGEARR